MPTVKIGKYKRPGIYIEEFDSSLIETPEITGLQSMVIGSSKKGPINVPITLNSQSDLQRIFGDLDRTLESKGSYFHRTISKLLEGSPVVAINLLNPDDDLDKLEYKSLSTSPEYNNDIKREQSYRRFFDTSTFWERDREAFLSITKENVSDENRIMHLTNLNDKEVTVFIVKASNTTGYNKSLLEWYGSVNKVPFFVDPKDYASDYMVDVVILDGNWTNYSSLSVDPAWSRYFNNSGLIKSELFNLADNPSVNNLYSWRGLSLIPYFRDIQGTNIFIETRINERTDRTGLYCAFDIDAVDTDYRNGFIDLLGSSLVGSVDEFGKPTTDIPNSIEFLSYKEDITEIKSYGEVSLDTPGNVYQLTFDSTYQNATYRKAMYAEGYINDFIYGSTTSTSFGFVSDGGGDEYVVIGGVKIELENKVFTPSDFPFTLGSTSSFSETFFIDTDGGIKMDPTNTQLQVGVVLGTMTFDIDVNGDFASVSYTPINLDGSGFVYFNDYYSDIGTPSITNDSITYEFLDTMGSVYPNDPKTYRRLKVYNQLVGILNNPNKDKSTILIGDDKKLSLKNLEISIPNNVYSNKTITISGFESNFDFTYLQNHGLVLHVIDNELVMGTEGLVTTDDYISGTVGIVSEWSDLYQDYFNGLINTGDKFYENITLTNIEWIKFVDVAGDDYIITDNPIPFTFNPNQEIIIPDATLNKGSFKISNPNPLDISDPLNTIPFPPGLTYGYAYEVVEDTVPETINNPTKIWNVDETFYTKFHIIDGILNVSFNGSNTGYTNNKILDIISQNSNFRQTVEIEMPTGYVRPSNVILADASRYTEIKIGDFLEALVDTSSLQPGEVPRRMTRVLSKKIYKGDPNLVEISCDSAINVHDFGGDLQTFRFTQIEDYVSTYKGISLKGFRLRPDSLPNGTDDRLNEITRIIGKGTPMYNSLVDKDVVDFRYLVDSYGLGLTELSKQVFADICGKRLDTFGILNMPSMTEFRKSSSPSFVDDEGRLSTELIAMGGDPNSSPAFNYSLAEGDGISCVGYFTPYVTVNDNGRPKNVPPAAWVATTFLRKHNSALTSVTPWTIAAGITDGQVTGIAGLEYTFNGTDIENLNGMCVNPIISKRNRGRVIETENTAQTLKTSALSFIHVREVLIELERDLADMLLQFQWKYNTPEIRAEIKLRADAICEDYVNRNGLYNFFNKIDSENNTPDIIDHQMGVLDTFVEPIKGMGVIVNNVTILKTGTINSGGFL